MSGVYRLVRHDGLVDRTTWWKDENRREPAGVWRIYGKGLGEEGRIATDAEIDLWHQVLNETARHCPSCFAVQSSP